MNILHIDSSARSQDSVTRKLTADIAARLGGQVQYRNLADPLPLLTETWIGANFTAADERDSVQADTLSLSDSLVAELEAADTIVIGAPMYNFSIPASLKAWIDLVCRAGVTFRYTENGPQGLLTGKRAIIVLASGGTELGGSADFSSAYLRHVLNFIGIQDVEMIYADRMMMDADAALSKAQQQVAQVAA